MNAMFHISVCSPDPASYRKIFDRLGLPHQLTVGRSLHECASFPDSPDAIVLEAVAIPSRDPLVLQEIQNFRKLFSIVLLAVLPEGADARDLRLVREAGADEVLRKPVNEQDMLDSISRCMNIENTVPAFFRKPCGVLERMGQGVTITNREGEFIYVNPSYARMAGRHPSEMIGLRPKDFTAPEDIPILTEQRKKRKQGVGSSYETDLLRPDGKRVPVLITAVPAAEHPDAGGALATVVDITYLKSTETQQDERQRQLVSLFENLPGFFYRCRFDKQWTMLFVSGNCRNITGYAPDELIGNASVSYNSLIDQEYQEAIWNMWGKTAEVGGIFEFEYPIYAKNKEQKWIWERGWAVYNEAGKVEYLEGFITDITKRKEMEEALRESEAQYRTLVETFPDGILLIDIHGRIIFSNHQTADMFGYSSCCQLIGVPVKQLASKDGDVCLSELISTLNKGSPVLRREITAVRKDGQEFPAELNCSLLFDRRGEACRGMVVVRDISERKQAQREYHKLQKQAAEGQRIESLGRLAGGIAHDYNNMLNVIIGYTELLLENPSVTDQVKEQLREIRQAGYRSSQLTRQLLAFAGKQPRDPRRVILHEAVRKCLDVFKKDLESRITLRFSPGRIEKTVSMDPQQLEHVLMLLLQNAYEAIEETGEIQISLKSSGEAKDTLSGDYVRLIIEDTGKGIPEQVISRMYEPFFTTKDERSNVGLGLPIVYGIIRQNGGDITISAREEGGTKVEVFLSAAETNPSFRE